MKKILTIITSVLIFAGCTSMNKDECELANWNAIGYSEGVSGQSMSTFQEYQNDCAEYRVKADYQAFKQGHYEGLSEFCSMERGINVASKGENYNAICKSSKFPQYNKGYQIGINQYCSYERGVSTGSSGKNYLKKCPNHSFPGFSDGYKFGLKQYCSYDNGYQLGLTGKSTNRNCSASQFTDFSSGFNAGIIRFNDTQALNKLEESLAQLSQDIEREEAKIVRAEASIISETSTPEVRKRALDNIKLHRETLSSLSLQYAELEQEIVTLTVKLTSTK